MIKKILFIFLLSPMILYGQSKSVFSNSGDLQEGKYILSSTIGQPFVNQVEYDMGILSEGFQQLFSQKIMNDSPKYSNKVFPNPTSGILQVTSSKPITSIQVFDLKGSLMKEYQVDNLPYFRFDVNDLRNAIYIIEITDNLKLKTIEKIIKI